MGVVTVGYAAAMVLAATVEWDPLPIGGPALINIGADLLPAVVLGLGALGLALAAWSGMPRRRHDGSRRGIPET